MNRLAFFEDCSALQFTPIALMRPVFELLCGQFSARERMLKSLPVEEWGVLIRPALTEVYSEEFPEARINDAIWLSEAPTLLINGRWLPAIHEIPRLANVTAESVGMMGDTVAYLLLEPEEATLLTTDAWDDAIQKIASTRKQVAVDGTELHYPWDLVNQNRQQLVDDFSLSKSLRPSTVNNETLTIVGPADLVSVDS
ncbi:MAG: hypothetical protein KDA74_21610, partial [Planctomycetaceae bacterium]|nr:hypothetical protein [Planctomycetaceae bacterium]